MNIFGITKNTRPNGTMHGKIHVTHDGKRYTVRFATETSGHAEQWGAPTEILCGTYPTFEKIIRGEL